jgi:uncharacterized protein (DUF488 family)
MSVTRGTGAPARQPDVPCPSAPLWHGRRQVFGYRSVITTSLISQAPQATIWTAGHSTRTIREFLDVLDAHHVEALVDVRRFPGSRRLPQFGSAELDRALTSAGVAYRWLPALGGRRKASSDSPNTGWRNESFRGYADHIASEEFAEGLAELLMIAGGLRTTVMCAELLWWRCHRRLIADVFLTQGHDVLHIRDASPAERHKLMEPARLVDGQLTYANPEPDQGELVFR